MLIKSKLDEIQSFLSDSSHMLEGFADRVVFPESPEEVAEFLAAATRDRTPVTVSGAGTGTVGARIPLAGSVLATDRLNKIKSISRYDHWGGSAVAEPGVVLADFQRFVQAEGLLYPPDPTERSCFLGGTVATNASGARSFKYGPTRNYIRRLKIALATGEMIDLRRGELFADANGSINIPLPGGRSIEARLPSFKMPGTRKHAAGYFVEPRMDVLDLFIGSEGTLGVIVEVETSLLQRPERLFSGVVFFADEDNLLGFVKDLRARSLRTRAKEKRAAELRVSSFPPYSESEQQLFDPPGIDARALEYFDVESLRFLRTRYPLVPEAATGAIFFEQETTEKTEDESLQAWSTLLQTHGALDNASWFATNEADHQKLVEFRHQLPVLMNEWFARHNQRKVSTDMAVPDEAFASLLRFYQNTLSSGDLRYTIFGHIGDNHVHVNILPRNDEEASKASEIYLQFVKRAVQLGGTISAEHGIGKLKRQYLAMLYGEEQLREMAALKRAFDPACILGRGNIFSEEYL
jgi:D-lactate dehydrogenase (cytochrome)